MGMNELKREGDDWEIVRRIEENEKDVDKEEKLMRIIKKVWIVRKDRMKKDILNILKRRKKKNRMKDRRSEWLKEVWRMIVGEVLISKLIDNLEKEMERENILKNLRE